MNVDQTDPLAAQTTELPVTCPDVTCLGLGSNSDPIHNLEAALERLRKSHLVVAVSGAWESPAHGCEAPNYVNAAVLVRTGLTKAELVSLNKQIENDLGRTRSADPSPTVSIDIDVLVFNGQIQTTDLWNLAYRAVPVAEILPDLRNPATSESMADASRRLAAVTQITPRPEIFLER